MAWQALCWRWLIQAGLGSLILYGGAYLLLAWRRQPAQKLKLIELALLGSFAAPCLSLLPAVPSWSIAGIDLGWSDADVSVAGAELVPQNRESAPPAIGGAPPKPIVAAGMPPSGASLAWWKLRILQQTILALYGLTALFFFARWLCGVCRLLAGASRSPRPG